MQVPMFAVQQKRLCGLSGLQAGDAGCLLTLIKAQIPFEVPGDPVLSDQKVHALPHHEHDEAEPLFGSVPASPQEFTALGDKIATAVHARNSRMTRIT